MIFLQNLMGAGSEIENIMTDRLDLDGLQVERYISKNYTSQVSQALSRFFFSVLSENLGRRLSTILRLSSCMRVSAAAGFYEFLFKFTLSLLNKIAKIT